MSAWPADFLDASDRHWNDGELLHAGGRWANADHLYGMAAECGLKAVMAGLGMPVDSMGVPAAPPRVHIDALWDAFVTFATARGAATYAAMLPTPNPFSDWSVHQRYANRSHFIQHRVNDHRTHASRVLEIVTTAAADGRI